MKFLARLFAGEVPLWRAFWLVGLPLSLVWDACVAVLLITGLGIGDLLLGGLIIIVFALASLAIVFVSIAIWRSATKYPREVWWQAALAIIAKLCALFSAFVAAISFLTVLFLLANYIYAGCLPV